MNNTLLKGLAVLELLARSATPLNLTQIGKALGLVKSNVHRLMQALVDEGFVLRDEDTGRYSASIKLWELGSAVLTRLDLRRHAELQMETLMRLTGESVHLSVLDGTEVVYVHKVDSLQPVRAYTQIGGRVPAHCVATGKAQLAFSSAQALSLVVVSLEAHTARTITDATAFAREMKKVRSTGHAVNRAEWREGVWGIASPIMDQRGGVIAGIGVSGPAGRFRREVVTAWCDAVKSAAYEVSRALGHAQPSGALSRVRFGPD